MLTMTNKIAYRQSTKQNGKKTRMQNKSHEKRQKDIKNN